MTFEQFLREYSQYISIAIFVIIVIVLALYIFIPLFKRKQPKKPDNKHVDVSNFQLALGGSDNILSISLSGSRLSVELVDMSAFDKDKLKALGVSRIVVMKTKLILLVDERFKHLGK